MFQHKLFWPLSLHLDPGCFLWGGTFMVVWLFWEQSCVGDCCVPFKKSLLNLLQYCFCFMFWCLGCEACGILVPDQGSNPHPLHWKAKSQPLDQQGSPWWCYFTLKPMLEKRHCSQGPQLLGEAVSLVILGLPLPNYMSVFQTRLLYSPSTWCL